MCGVFENLPCPRSLFAGLCIKDEDKDKDKDKR